VCILFRPLSTSHGTFPEIDPDIIPIFAASTSLTIGKMSIGRRQVPITPAWAVTDYKVQGTTCNAVTLDLHRGKTSKKGASGHNIHCSSYVQLSRVRTIQDVHLLQRVTLEDLNAKPDQLLSREEQRLADLARATDIAWAKIESSDEFRLGRRDRAKL
jgi:hypothetical protein